jgi:hypothetical protein
VRTTKRFSSNGLSVTEYLCDSGPDDTPFIERHHVFGLSCHSAYHTGQIQLIKILAMK